MTTEEVKQKESVTGQVLWEPERPVTKPETDPSAFEDVATTDMMARVAKSADGTHQGSGSTKENTQDSKLTKQTSQDPEATNETIRDSKLTQETPQVPQPASETSKNSKPTNKAPQDLNSNSNATSDSSKKRDYGPILSNMSLLDRSALLTGPLLAIVVLPASSTAKPSAIIVPRALLLTFSTKCRDLLADSHHSTITLRNQAFSPDAVKAIVSWLYHTCTTQSAFRVPFPPDMLELVEHYAASAALGINEATRVLYKPLADHICAAKGKMEFGLIDKIGACVDKGDKLMRHMVFNMAYAEALGMLNDDGYYREWVAKRPRLGEMLEESKRHVVMKFEERRREKEEWYAMKESEKQHGVEREGVMGGKEDVKLEGWRKERDIRERRDEGRRQREEDLASHRGGYDRVLTERDLAILGFRPYGFKKATEG